MRRIPKACVFFKSRHSVNGFRFYFQYYKVEILRASKKKKLLRVLKFFPRPISDQATACFLVHRSLSRQGFPLLEIISTANQSLDSILAWLQGTSWSINLRLRRARGKLSGRKKFFLHLKRQVFSNRSQEEPSGLSGYTNCQFFFFLTFSNTFLH